ncbi:MAG: molybdopterin-dependent oxidoreductase [Planctomycetaceae bacterium]|nr:molybdopterin-dependent oxidoreductase [Planctomycetales bacterium]MCB9927614.1 molybdopterin-dependent oxidoreductase [Planctomycetaceae bacterium]
MNRKSSTFLGEHTRLTRRFFLGSGMAGLAAIRTLPLLAEDRQRDPKLQKQLDALDSWLTHPDKFRDVSRGNPKPHSLTEEQRTAVGLTRDTWTLELLSDPEHPAKLGATFSKQANTPFDFNALLKLAEQHAVSFPKAMTCLNIGCPLGNGIWEGVPLREVLWLTQPRENVRRVFYYGYHNDDPKQMFRSSLPVGRVLEDPFDLPPVILCYKLNGEWLSPERGGPVRLVFPEGYGFKSIKWLTHIYLSNLAHANDTYAEQNNDVDSPLKTFCATLSLPGRVKANEPIPVTGYAQVGISGLKKVQVWVHRDGDELPANDRYFSQAPWTDANILAPPEAWGGGITDNRIPATTLGFSPDTGQPTRWPIRLSMVHWAALLPGLAPGEYTFRCRTIDDKGIGQPLPRPFRKSGHAAIEQLSLTVEA